jgi:hypothetical protein
MSSIAHLLMDKTRIQKFKNFFQHSIAGGFALPGLTSKATLLSSLATMSGRAEVTASDEELYKDALWTYLARFKNRRTRILNPLLHARARDAGAMRFDHSISTDGYSITMVISDREIRGRKHQFKSAVSAKKFKPKSKTNDEFPSLKVERAYDILTMLDDLGNPTLLGGDPGKNVLLMLIDERGAALRYTAAQRREDTLSTFRKKTLQRAMHRKTTVARAELPTRAFETPSSSTLENQMRKARVSSKTQDLARFRLYIAFREASRRVFDATYTRREFRAMRFLAWTRRRSSVEQFAKRILQKYGGALSPVQVCCDSSPLQSCY